MSDSLGAELREMIKECDRWRERTYLATVALETIRDGRCRQFEASVIANNVLIDMMNVNDQKTEPMSRDLREALVACGKMMREANRRTVENLERNWRAFARDLRESKKETDDDEA